VNMQSESSVLRLPHPHVPRAVIIKFNRPHVKNALGPADMLTASRHLLDCQHDPAVGTIILTGAGDAFSSGVDLKVHNSLSPDERAEGLQVATELLTRIVTSPKIIVAAVNGASSGLGNHILLCSDLCIMRRDATLHFTGIRKGLPSMQYGALLLPMIIGLKRAKSLLLRGGQLTAAKAESLGICNEIVELDRWDSAITELAEELGEGSSAALAFNKFQLNQFAFNMLGALKLSVLGGAAQMAAGGEVITGRLGGAGNP
jgi:enoyl-CoA hydratase/carnithine racemase